MTIYIDFTYGYNFLYKGTFRAGLSLAIFLTREAKEKVVCLCCAQKDKAYLLSNNLSIKFIPMNKNKYIRNLSRIIIFYFLQLTNPKSKFIFVGTFNPLAPFNGISFVHDLYILDIPKIYTPMQRIFFKYLVINSALFSKKIIVLSENLSNRLKNLYNKKNIFIYRYMPNISISEIHKKTDRTILVVLKNTKNKNSNLIFQVFKKILDLQKDIFWKLIIVSSDNDELLEISSIYNIPLTNLEFHKNISDDNLLNLFSSSQIYLTFSNIEGFGLSTRLAILQGCIVIAPNTLINREASWNLAAYFNDFKISFIAKLIIKKSKNKNDKIKYYENIKNNLENDILKNKQTFKDF